MPCHVYLRVLSRRRASQIEFWADTSSSNASRSVYAIIHIRTVSAEHLEKVKDLLAYLQLIDNPHFVPAFNRVINVPARGIGDKVCIYCSYPRLCQGGTRACWSADTLALRQSLRSWLRLSASSSPL